MKDTQLRKDIKKLTYIVLFGFIFLSIALTISLCLVIKGNNQAFLGTIEDIQKIKDCSFLAPNGKPVNL